jgi:long-chain acyl-CoA synthetase
MYLTQGLHRALQQHPDKTAIVGAELRLTYRAWVDRSARLATVLHAHGVTRGTRVAIFAGNEATYLVCYAALWWIGAVACPINTRWSRPEIAFSLRDCGVELLLVDARHAPIAAALRDEVAALRHVLRLDDGALDYLMGQAAPAVDQRCGDDELAAVLYTGGTTGHPKGVMLSHRNLGAAALARLAATPQLSDSVVLLATPMFHAASIGRFLPHVMAGATCVVVPDFRAEEVFALIEAEGVTDLPLVPSMLQTLLEHSQFAPQRLLSVRRIGYGAAPIDEALLERALRALPGVDFAQSYGMTECAALATISLPSDHGREARSSGRSRSAGRACAVMELRILGPDGEDICMGEVGEIVLRGPNVMLGYWNRPEETAQALRDGWLHTGDAGRLDTQGCLFVVDRLKDMIVTGGENVYGAEVENALLSHPAVKACSVFAIPSVQWGEAVHAVVVLRDGIPAAEAELRAHCRLILAGYKCPKQIEFSDALPMTAAGKVAKNILRAPYWQGHERRVA